MFLCEMTSPEVAALPRDIVVLIPVASCEQHSLHLPVWTDSFIGQDVARRVHEKIPDDVIVLPVQWLGYSQHHSRYPGTVSAISSTHVDLMLDMVDSMVRHGFRKILLQNSHGGNSAGIQVLLQRLMEKYPEEEAEFYSRWAWAGNDTLNSIRTLPGGSGHAGETETAMMLAIRPDLVRSDRLDPACGCPGSPDTTVSINARSMVASVIRDHPRQRWGRPCWRRRQRSRRETLSRFGP